MISFTYVLKIIEEIGSDSPTIVAKAIKEAGENAGLATIKTNVSKLMSDNGYEAGDYKDLDSAKLGIKFLLKKKTDELIGVEERYKGTKPDDIQKKNELQKPILDNIKILTGILNGFSGGKTASNGGDKPEGESDFAKLINGAAATAEEKAFRSMDNH